MLITSKRGGRKVFVVNMFKTNFSSFERRTKCLFETIVNELETRFVIKIELMCCTLYHSRQNEIRIFHVLSATYATEVKFYHVDRLHNSQTKTSFF